MSYFDHINRSIEFIENNICEELRLEEIAKEAGLSKWYFQRQFRAMVGDTVTEYILTRRLSLAAKDLLNTSEKIIDIAMRYSFESHEVFSRAFRRIFNTNPSDFRSLNLARSTLPLKKKVTADYLNHLYGGISMQPTILKMNEMLVIGVSGAIKSIHDPKFPENFEVIPGLWKKFREGIDMVSSELQSARIALIGPMSEDDADSDLEYIAGVMVLEKVNVPPDFVFRTIAAGEFAEFIHKGPVSNIEHTMNFIYGSWLPKSGRLRGSGPDISIFSESFAPSAPDAEIKIRIPIL